MQRTLINYKSVGDTLRKEDRLGIKIHYRRCHVCGTTNECIGELVTECEGCHKRLLPFFYYDEREAMGISLLVAKVKMKTRLPHESYPPLQGLSSFWQMDEE